MLTYKPIRSQRKTAVIHITADAEVEVRAPIKMSKSFIDGFVASKEDWIIWHLDRRKRINSEKAAFSLNYGDAVTLCGKMYLIREKGGKRSGFDGECFFVPPELTAEELKRVAVQIYKAAAKRVITGKVYEYAEIMKVKPASVRITSAKTRWGSCSGKNGLSFSWKLVMTDDNVIDYVVVHELAHITEHNHSPSFWAVVGNVLPDFKERRASLKALQEKLSREDWG